MERRLTSLEEDEGALVFSSGMATISTCLFHLLRSRCKLVLSRDVYGMTISLAKSFERFGVKVELRGPETEEVVDAIEGRARWSSWSPSRVPAQSCGLGLASLLLQRKGRLSDSRQHLRHP